MSTKIEVTRENPSSREIESALQVDGYALCSFTESESCGLELALEFMDRVLMDVATPIKIFDRHEKWRPIGVDPARDPSRSEGVGVSPLHMDFVNAANPPDVIMLYCERSDPAGGGNTTLAPTCTAEWLDPSYRKKLQERCYVDGRVVNLANIGADINPFAIISDGQSWRFRYTDQLLNSDLDDEGKAAVGALHQALKSEMIDLPLNAGDAIIIDQRRMLHGRLALGCGQEAIPSGGRRLIWQRFGRKRNQQ